MKIFITGGTGFVGSRLSRRLLEEGHEVGILTRSAPKPQDRIQGVRFVEGDPREKGTWQEVVAEYDLYINLAGASIFGRWTEDYKRRLLNSRIDTTRNLVEAIPKDDKKTLFSTSAVGYYGFHEDEALDESSPPGDDFLASLAVQWENEAKAAAEKGVRVAITRFGIVMGKGGGALAQMVTPFRFFVGGPLGSGKQFLSWVHIDDLVGAFAFLIGRPELSGPFNLTAPNPVRNEEFSKTLGKVLGRPSWLPAPGFMIKAVMGEFGSVILRGQRVLPKTLLEADFTFRFPTLEAALRDLLP
jgi:uncharacterized protein (TIGR01777 family)